MAAKMAQQRAERTKNLQADSFSSAQPAPLTVTPTAVQSSEVSAQPSVQSSEVRAPSSASSAQPISSSSSRTEQLLAAARARIDKPVAAEEPVVAEETVGQSGVARSRANEILARAKALAAAAKAKEVK